MEDHVQFRFDGSKHGTSNIYITYDVSIHGTTSIERVCLAGDLMEITNKISETDMKKLVLLIDRRRLRARTKR